MFNSFEEALQVCLQAKEGSPEQEAALMFCLQSAPPDLRLMLNRRRASKAGHDETQPKCGCGCGGNGE